MVKPKLINSKDLASDLKRINEEENKAKLITSAKGNLDLASRAIKQGNLELALTHLDRGLEVNPDNPELVTLRAKVYALRKEYDSCLDDVEYMLQINPKDEEALEARKILNKILDYHKKVTQFPIYS